MKPDCYKTLVGVLASHDDAGVNNNLVSLFYHFFHHENKERLEKFHFVFTGGTYDRIFHGDKKLGVNALPVNVANWLKKKCGVTRLPSTRRGGVTTLSFMVCRQRCSIVWPFFAPKENHWLRPENLAFMRLCDQWHVKRLMNRGSVMVWFDLEAEFDAIRNAQACPPMLKLLPDGCEVTPIPGRRNNKFIKFDVPQDREPYGAKIKPRVWTKQRRDFATMTLALIAHDDMKSRMIEFAIDHEPELVKFGRILATGTTGREVAAATSRRVDKRMVRFHSGPKGGDVEIATSIIHGACDVVIFFIDPLRPHPHIEDIRIVFQDCMVEDQVVMITNEMHAREFMSRVVRGKDSLVLYP